MDPINRDQILGFEQWQKVRDILRPLFIHEKERRRFSVGSHITLLFENAQSAWYQVQEMIRSESMTDPQAIQHEIDTYNELLPHSGAFSATLLVEYADTQERDAALKRLVGLERHIRLKLGERNIAGQFDERQMSTDRISAVQFVRFPVDGIDADEFLKLAQANQVTVQIDHPNLAAEARITGLIALALAEDLRAG